VTENAAIFAPNEGGNSLPLWLVTEAEATNWLTSQSTAVANWLKSQNFRGDKGRVVAWPAPDGQLAGAVAGLGALGSARGIGLWQAAALAEKLPAALWHCANEMQATAAWRLALGFGLGRYRFDRFRGSPAPAGPRLRLPANVDVGALTCELTALARARDLINMPANELGPAELADTVRAVAKTHGAEIGVTDGVALQRAYPLIAAVGQGSSRAPCLIDLHWGRPGAPKVTLVGKGVCFDSGGLDIKPSAGMLLMKKDMGGAACALAVAEILMASGIDIRLRLLIAAVENSVDGSSYRPGDVLRSRQGLTVEIGNTDAEGRLVLADALTDADAELPDLLVDFATLTGAARTALGPELPAAFSNDSALLAQLAAAGESVDDPLWPMPLWLPYDDDLASKVADVNNVASHGFAGAIVGALFLHRFVAHSPRWIHLDLYGWNARERPGRPVGAEAQCVRAVVELIRQRQR
jgi:leucyl aminopeptidase